MDDDLQRMKNLGKTSVQWLHAVGIHNGADLRRLGAIQAYRAVRTRGFRATKVLLYALEGALLNRHWCDLSADCKDLLNQELDSLGCEPRKNVELSQKNSL